MSQQIFDNLKRLEKLGLHHVKFSLASEGLSTSELIKRVGLIKRFDQTKDEEEVGLPIFVEVGGCMSFGEVSLCRDLLIDGITFPMIETDFAQYRAVKLIDLIYAAGNKPFINIKIESLKSYNYCHALIKRPETKGHIAFYTIGRNLLMEDANALPRDCFIDSAIKEMIDFCFTKEIQKFSIVDNIMSSNINQITKNFNPTFVETRNFCILASNNPEDEMRMQQAIKIAYQTQIMISEFFNIVNNVKIVADSELVNG